MFCHDYQHFATRWEKLDQAPYLDWAHKEKESTKIGQVCTQAERLKGRDNNPYLIDIPYYADMAGKLRWDDNL